jgi:hypothetical protein
LVALPLVGLLSGLQLPEEETAYTDTLGDLALGTTGALVAATITATVLWTARRRARRLVA